MKNRLKAMITASLIFLSYAGCNSNRTESAESDTAMKNIANEAADVASELSAENLDSVRADEKRQNDSTRK